MDIEFVAGFSAIVSDRDEAKRFYVDALGLPLGSDRGTAPDIRRAARWPVAHALAPRLSAARTRAADDVGGDPDALSATRY
ncbi:MAG: hypothetical protein R2706_20670 [Acidimicrobiales bacterium]